MMRWQLVPPAASPSRTPLPSFPKHFSNYASSLLAVAAAALITLISEAIPV